MKKVLWLDLETTGLDCNNHGIIQIAMLMDITGKSASMIIKELVHNKYAMITHKPKKLMDILQEETDKLYGDK